MTEHRTTHYRRFYNSVVTVCSKIRKNVVTTSDFDSVDCLLLQVDNLARAGGEG